MKTSVLIQSGILEFSISLNSILSFPSSSLGTRWKVDGEIFEGAIKSAYSFKKYVSLFLTASTKVFCACEQQPKQQCFYRFLP